MKKIFFLILFSISAFCIKAQYTITATSNPIPGDIQSYIILDTVGLQLGSSGVSQTWNYANVNVFPYPPITATYVALSSVPNNTMFPSGTIGVDEGGGNFGVLSNNTTKFEYLGYATATASNCWAYTDPFKPYVFPFAYGFTTTDNYLLYQPTNITVGSFTTYGDGTGTLALPTATIANVLKLKYVQYESDTNSTGSIQTFTIIMDQYHSAANKFPLLEVRTFTETVTTGTNVTTTYYKFGRIFTSYYPLGIETKEKISAFNLFPNPVTNGELFISGMNSPDKTTIEIYNVLGQTVKTVFIENQSGTETKKINVSGLAKGIYYVRFTNKTAIKTQKIIIE